ncbi:MAG: transcription antitermination factor NusB [Vicinamibacterales bacterium]
MTRRRGDVRHEARESALQMLYEWEIGGADVDHLVATSWAIQARPLDVDRDALAGALVRGTIARMAEIDALIAAAAEHWRLERIAVIDRLILRMAVFELIAQPDTPRAVVIDEAVELAKRFSSADASRFVNGVLDGITRRLDAPAGS